MKRTPKKQSERQIIEIALTVLSFWWAALLSFPFQTFQLGASYSAMSELAPEWVWALVILMIGTIQLIGFLQKKQIIRRTGLLLATGLWFFVSAMFAVGEVITTGGVVTTAAGTYAIIGGMASWKCVKGR